MVNIYWMLVRMLGRGRLTAVDDSGPVQAVQMQLSQSELRDGTPRLAEYGFHSNPPPGADAVIVCLGGDRTQGVVIACGHQKYRMTGLQSGEVAIADDKGRSIYISEAGIVINGNASPITVKTEGGIVVNGNASPIAVETAGGIAIDGKAGPITVEATGGIVINGKSGSVAVEATAGIFLTAPVVQVSESLSVGNGATGTFTTPTGQIVTVQDGIVTNIF